jgi:hypothetical protein
MEPIYTECVVCMDAPEDEVCPVCNLTGPEIILARAMVVVDHE